MANPFAKIIDEAQISTICQRSIHYNDERQKHILNHERWFKKRFGIRPTSVTWPWPGAANLHLPLIDKTIRRSKPNFYNSIVGVTPTVTFQTVATGDDLELVRGVEREFDRMLHEKMRIFKPLAFGIDKMLERGYFVASIIQEFRSEIVHEKVDIKDRFSEEVQALIYSPDTTDDMLAQEIEAQFDMDLEDDTDKEQIKIAVKQIREGKDVIEFERESHESDHPSLYVKDSVYVIVPPDTCDIEDARQIEDRIPMTFEDILFRGQTNRWDRDNTMELLRRMGYDPDAPTKSTSTVDSNKEQVQQLEEQREGTATITEDLPVISQIFCWHKWPGRKLPVRTVITVHRDHPDLPLKVREYDYIAVSGLPAKWPFVQVTFEIVGDRYHSPRGYSQMLDSLQTELVNNHNAKQNWMTIANSLNLKVKKTANISTGWIPGQPFYVNRMDDVEVMEMGAKDMSFDNEERILKGWAEEYIGLLDSTLMQPTVSSGSGEARTKAEIDAVQNITVQVAGADIQVFQMGMQRIYEKIWERWMQFGPKEIKYTNGIGDEVSVPKQDIKRKFLMFPTANIGNVSKQMRYTRSLNRLSLFKGDPYFDQYELRKDFLINDDERLVERMLRSEGQIQQSEIERQIFEISMIAQGYPVVPRPTDDDKIHMAVIEQMLKDPVKRAKFPPDQLENLMNHHMAHKVAEDGKMKASTRGGRAMQEVAAVALGQPKEGQNGTGPTSS